YRSSATESVEGSGLGLSIVREIVRVHEGEIALGDAPGGGLVVTVRLPLAPAALPARAEPGTGAT
ncbi:sensor histidine kinase, partial [Burkholderia sp. Ap-962]|uniref:ATP-binding protein n=1 Tax=Burkholderia sp. Ap-962 TaxID=2608333 RepID=UPI00142046AB